MIGIRNRLRAKVLAKQKPIGDLLLFLLIASCYYASHFPIAASNEGSHFALLSSLLEDARFTIDRFSHYTFYRDFAFRNGHFYADRAPGTMLVSIPLYILGDYLAPLLTRYGERELIIKHVVLVGPALAGALCCLLLLRILQRLLISETVAWVTTMTLAFASLNWKFSAHLFSHIFLEMNVMLVFKLLVDAKTSPATADRRFLWLATGTLPVFGYEGLAFWPIVFLVLRFLPPDISTTRTSLFHTSSWFFFPIVVLAAYNTACWGAPWASYGAFQNPDYWGNLSLKDTFTNSLPHGLYQLLFQFPGNAYPRGLFVLQPYLLLALPGLWLLFRNQKLIGLLCASMIGSLLVFFAKFWDPAGGSSGDPRYILPLVGLTCVPLAYSLEFVVELGAWPRLRAVFIFLFFLLGGAGFFMCLVHFANFYGHDFYFQKDIEHFSLASWEFASRLFTTIFIAWRWLPLLYFVVSLIALLRLVAWLLGRLLDNTRSPLLVNRLQRSLLVTIPLTVAIFCTWIGWRSIPTPVGASAVVRSGRVASIVERFVASSADRKRFDQFSSGHELAPLPLAKFFPTIDGAIFAVTASGNIVVPEAVETLVKLRIDDELIIKINDAEIFSSVGVKGVVDQEVSALMRAGPNHIELFYTNLMGLGTLSFQHTTKNGETIEWRCQANRGLCYDEYRFPSYARVDSSSPLASVQDDFLSFPIELEYSKPSGAILTSAELDNPGKPGLMRLNLLFDDELLVKLNGAIQFERGGVSAPGGGSIILTIPNGQNRLDIYYSNILDKGWFRAGLFPEDQNFIEVRPWIK